jgi:hypothetical protein
MDKRDARLILKKSRKISERTMKDFKASGGDMTKKSYTAEERQAWLELYEKNKRGV